MLALVFLHTNPRKYICCISMKMQSMKMDPWKRITKIRHGALVIRTTQTMNHHQNHLTGNLLQYFLSSYLLIGSPASPLFSPPVLLKLNWVKRFEEANRGPIRSVLSPLFGLRWAKRKENEVSHSQKFWLAWDAASMAAEPHIIRNKGRTKNAVN